MSMTQEEREYYEHRISEELRLMNEDWESIKQRGVNSVRMALEYIARRIGLAIEKMMEFFGPLFDE